MIERLTELMVQSGADWVLWLLIGLSVLSLGVAIERAWVFRASQGNVQSLVPELRTLLRRDQYERARQLLESERGVEARVVGAGLAESDLGSAAVEAAMAAAMGLERKRLEKRLLFLGTVGKCRGGLANPRESAGRGPFRGRELRPWAWLRP
jgi:biopolymer transport protein ExbB